MLGEVLQSPGPWPLEHHPCGLAPGRSQPGGMHSTARLPAGNQGGSAPPAVTSPCLAWAGQHGAHTGTSAFLKEQIAKLKDTQPQVEWRKEVTKRASF